MVNTADVSRAAPVNTARRCSVSGLVEPQLYMWCVQVYPCDCLKTEDFWRGSFWDVRFSPACRACKDEISSGWWRAASEQQIKTRRDMQAARDRQIIREGRSGRHTQTHTGGLINTLRRWMCWWSCFMCWGSDESPHPAVPYSLRSICSGRTSAVNLLSSLQSHPAHLRYHLGLERGWVVGGNGSALNTGEMEACCARLVVWH